MHKPLVLMPSDLHIISAAVLLTPVTHTLAQNPSILHIFNLPSLGDGPSAKSTSPLEHSGMFVDGPRHDTPALVFEVLESMI